MSAPKTTEQLRAIFGLGRKVHMADEDLRDLAEDVTNGRTRSLRELTFVEANAMIVRLGGEAFPVSPSSGRPTPRRTVNHRRQKAGVVTMVSPAALAKLDALAAERGMSPSGLERMCLRMLHTKRPTTALGCSKVIEALKAMNARDPNPKSKIRDPKSKIGRAA